MNADNKYRAFEHFLNKFFLSIIYTYFSTCFYVFRVSGGSLISSQPRQYNLKKQDVDKSLMTVPFRSMDSPLF
ncbi:hypothetical protein T01_14276 [Trichinella spiralis]|uniref:Uncharacterized protein n=1 Tax=Trichinella spiralis TaxID=6334 RepID=A0A0V1B0L4_TRISP|nr:hypothetical protein T01_14276 [Trichinella spiralis]